MRETEATSSYDTEAAFALQAEEFGHRHSDEPFRWRKPEPVADALEGFHRSYPEPPFGVPSFAKPGAEELDCERELAKSRRVSQCGATRIRRCRMPEVMYSIAAPRSPKSTKNR